MSGLPPETTHDRTQITHTHTHTHTEAHFISLVFLRKCRNKTKKKYSSLSLFLRAVPQDLLNGIRSSIDDIHDKMHCGADQDRIKGPAAHAAAGGPKLEEAHHQLPVKILVKTG